MCGYFRNIYLFHKSIMQTLKKGMWWKGIGVCSYVLWFETDTA